MDKFKVGDTVVARYTIRFCDGTKHTIGERIVIKKGELAYFLVNSHDYYLADREDT